MDLVFDCQEEPQGRMFRRTGKDLKTTCIRAKTSAVTTVTRDLLSAELRVCDSQLVRVELQPCYASMTTAELTTEKGVSVWLTVTAK